MNFNDEVVAVFLRFRVTVCKICFIFILLIYRCTFFQSLNEKYRIFVYLLCLNYLFYSGLKNLQKSWAVSFSFLS